MCDVVTMDVTMVIRLGCLRHRAWEIHQKYLCSTQIRKSLFEYL